eukprot:9995043-Ditylum_brightwellii.AAC.1
MQQWGMDFWETYSPVVNWIAVQILLAVASIHELLTKCIDFVLAFPQAELDINVFMEIPIRMTVPGSNTNAYLVELICLTADVKGRENLVRPPLLHKNLDGPDRKQQWNYRSAVGMASHLQGSTHPEKAMAIHQ